MIDSVIMYPECYTYYLEPLRDKFKAMKDDAGVSFKTLHQEILTAIEPAKNTRTKDSFIARLDSECFTKRDLCQMVENSCKAGKKTPMVHYA